LDKLIIAIDFRYLCINSDVEIRKVSCEEEEQSWSKKLISYQCGDLSTEIQEMPIEIKCEPLINQFQDFSSTSFKPTSKSSKNKTEKATKAKPNNSKKVACKICFKSFSRGALWSHMKRFHSDIKEELFCHHCEKTFNAYNTLEKHISKEHDSILSDYLCDVS
jgi:hypothetical protein